MFCFFGVRLRIQLRSFNRNALKSRLNIMTSVSMCITPPFHLNYFVYICKYQSQT